MEQGKARAGSQLSEMEENSQTKEPSESQIKRRKALMVFQCLLLLSWPISYGA